jgi:hypothetical protein
MDSPERTIELTNGKQVAIDPADYDLVSGLRWYEVRGYAAARVRGGGVVLMHVYIMTGGDYNGARQESVVDHKDGDRLRNTRDNLRWATYRQNGYNKGKASGKSSAYKGVSKCSDRDRWLACVHVGNKSITLGRFATELEAAAAYNEAACALFGKWARLNNLRASEPCLVPADEIDDLPY